MAEFSRIRVTPAEEEDIVIVAGAVEEAAPGVQSNVSVETPASDRAVDSDGMSSPTSPESSAPYEETRLADLEPTRMSGMQKAIIAVAIVAVVAFIIWYVLLR